MLTLEITSNFNKCSLSACTHALPCTEFLSDSSICFDTSRERVCVCLRASDFTLCQFNCTYLWLLCSRGAVFFSSTSCKCHFVFIQSSGLTYAIYVDHGKVLVQIAHDRNFCVIPQSHLDASKSLYKRNSKKTAHLSI